MTSLANIRRQAQRGFTLVELLIVVIILAILAAIVVPQFSSSTDDAKLTALDSNLSNMRAAIALYKQQHGHFPGSVTAAGATCPNSGTAGTGAATDDATRVTAFGDQMSMYTNAAGQACSTSDANFKFGPYLKSRTLPNDPVTNLNTLVTVAAGDLNLAATGGTGGWKYDVLSGKLINNNPANVPNTNPQTTYSAR